jgi:hypothetical protein
LCSAAQRREEVLGELGDVLAPLAQRGDLDPDDVEAVVEVLPETCRFFTSSSTLRLVAARTRTSTLDLRARADAAHLALLQHAQELHLEGGGSSPISSSSTVPPSASRKIPGVLATSPP